MVTIKVEALTALAADIFAGVGSSKEEAQQVARSLVGANLAGHDSHGVIRVPRYVAWVESGDIVPNQTVQHLLDAPSFAVLDGRYGFGQSVAPQAVAIGMEKAKAEGLSAVALKNAGHVGRVGEWAEMAAAEELVSVHFVNASGSVLVAPFGGVERRMSTAPFCVGIPREGEGPIVLDFATSLVAEGKVMVASQGGKKLPDGALIGPDGKLSTDPALLYGPHTPEGPRDNSKGEGAIRAFGEHKGSGLALICELIGGALTGTGATQPERGRFANGMFSIYIDPIRFDPAHFFDSEVKRYLGYIKGTKPARGVTEVLVPGEPERRVKAERMKNGVPLTDDTWAAISAAARHVGLSDARIVEAGALQGKP
jgi:hydroxycarboxylate dehydrogenase B